MDSPTDENEADMSTVSAKVVGTLYWPSFCGINLSKPEKFSVGFICSVQFTNESNS